MPAPMPVPPSPRPVHTALVLQGGGALGSYQAGVYEGMARNGMAPDWLAGVSIGGINAALIAGNPPERRVERLREFWDLVSSGLPLLPRVADPGGEVRTVVSRMSAALVAATGVPGFFEPAFPGPFFSAPGTPGALSFYDTTPLRRTLLRLVDFDRLNDGAQRLMVGAVDLRTGNATVFDTAAIRIGPEHIMASAALPPGFPPVEIGGELYWDGGLVSNTPLQFVLDAAGDDQDLLVLQVDLFSASGPLPRTMMEAEEREKDIRFSSRTRANTTASLRLHQEKAALRRVLESLPEALADSEDARLLRDAARENAVTVVQMIYRKRAYEGSVKDYEFSRQTMREHWASGRADVEHLVARHGTSPMLPAEGGMLVIDPGREV